MLRAVGSKAEVQEDASKALLSQMLEDIPHTRPQQPGSTGSCCMLMLPALDCAHGRLDKHLRNSIATLLTSGGVRLLEGVAKAEMVLLVAAPGWQAWGTALASRPQTPAEAAARPACVSLQLSLKVSHLKLYPCLMPVQLALACQLATELRWW